MEVPEDGTVLMLNHDAFGITVTPHRQWAWLGDRQGPSWELTPVGVPF